MLLLFSSHFFAQGQKSSDLVKYYIILDNSGSVANLDTQHNLRSMIEAFTHVNHLFDEGTAINSTKRLLMEFSTYGDPNKTPTSVTLDFRDSNKYQAGLINLQRMLSQEVKMTSEILYSDIKSSLETTLNNIINDQSDGASTGIIVFTDGKLSAGDLPEEIDNDRSLYKEQLDQLLLRIEGIYSTPVFFVSTRRKSTERNDYLLEKRFDDPVISEQEKVYRLGGKSFWIDSATDFKSKADSSSVKHGFRQFQALVSETIMDFGYYESMPEDRVYTAVRFQELIKFKNSNPEVNVIINDVITKNYQRYQQKINSLVSLLTLSEGVSFDYKKVDDILKELSKTPEVIPEIIQKTKVEIDKKRIESLKRIKELNDSLLASQSFSELKQNELQVNKVNQENIVNSWNTQLASPLKYNSFSWKALQPLATLDMSSLNIIATSGDLESDLIKGFNDYLIERSKLEVIYALFENMKTGLDKIKMNKLFPETWKLLENPNNYHDFAIIHTAFKSDLDRLPQSILTDTSLVKKSPEFVGLFYTVNLIQELMKGKDLETAFSELAKKRIFDINTQTETLTSKNEKLAFITQEYILLTLKILSKKEHDVSEFYKDEKLVVNELTVMLSSISLADIDAKSLVFKNLSTKTKGDLKTLYEKYDQLKLELKNLQQLINKIPEADFKDFQEYRYSVVMDVLQRISDLFIESQSIFSDIKPNLEIDEQDVSKVFEGLKAIGEFYFSLRKKDYQKALFIASPYLVQIALEKLPEAPSPALLSAKDFRKLDYQIGLKDQSFRLYMDGIEKFSSMSTNKKDATENLTKLLGKEANGNWLVKNNEDKFVIKDKYQHKVKRQFKRNKWFFVKNINSENHQPLVPYNDHVIYTYKSFKKIIKSPESRDLLFLKAQPYLNPSRYGDRVEKLIKVSSQIASVKSSEEVKNLLAESALPVASYRVKRNSRGIFMITAYPSLGIINYINERTNFGLIAPVGIEYSIGNRNFFAGRGRAQQSLSFMASLFDFGNIINYQTTDNDDADFKLEGIFSPGINTSFGFSSKVPVNLNLGYMFIPDRFTISLALDLPLFNLKNN
jgi:hypothetical protein